MATAMTRFEIQLPLFTDGTPQSNAVNTFLDNIGTLCTFVWNPQSVYTNHDRSNGAYIAIVYGLITAAQQATALGYLNTLNAALGAPVLCTVNNVTSEP